MKASNLVSLSRLAFLFFHLLVASRLSPWVNVALVIVNYVADVFDGIVARRRGGTSYGEFMDISVDRVITLGYFAYHLYFQRLNLAFFVLVFARNFMVDYVAHFNLILKGGKQKHTLTQGVAKWLYSSKPSKLINGGLQATLTAWGFLGQVPLVLQLVFLVTSYLRALPDIRKLAHYI